MARGYISNLKCEPLPNTARMANSLLSQVWPFLQQMKECQQRMLSDVKMSKSLWDSAAVHKMVVCIHHLYELPVLTALFLCYKYTGSEKLG